MAQHHVSRAAVERVIRYRCSISFLPVPPAATTPPASSQAVRPQVGALTSQSPRRGSHHSKNFVFTPTKHAPAAGPPSLAIPTTRPRLSQSSGKTLKSPAHALPYFDARRYLNLCTFQEPRSSTRHPPSQSRLFESTRARQLSAQTPTPADPRDAADALRRCSPPLVHLHYQLGGKDAPALTARSSAMDGVVLALGFPRAEEFFFRSDRKMHRQMDLDQFASSRPVLQPPFVGHVMSNLLRHC
ncbi:hypothetical protein IWZ01DRAFT_479793 [Phyllosticta capitalensis]